MKRVKLLGLGVFVIALFMACEPGCERPPIFKEIGTYDILLDYDKEKGTNIADVYRETMDLLYDINLSGDKLTEIVDTVNGRVIHFFGVRHQSRLAIIRFLRNVLPFIQNPKEWVFLIEGCEGKEILLPEVYFLKGVAEELGIDTYDPIVSPLGEDVTRRLVRGTPPMVTLKDIHFAQFEDVFPNSASLDTLNERSRERYISVFASYSILPRDSIAVLLDEYDSLYLKHPLRLVAAKKVFSQIRRDMIDTSNVLSRVKLERNLDKIIQAKHVFVCVGNYHRPVFEDLDTLLNDVYEIHVITQEEPSTN